jgi:hypothetical protein
MSEAPPARSLGADLEWLEEGLRELVREQPVLTVGAAAGLGFLLGGGPPRGVVTLLLGIGARMAGAWLEQEFLERADAQENER